MPNIPASQVRAEFTQALIAVYKERITPTAFGRSFFPTVTSASKYVSIEVQRGTEKIAVDVERGAEGKKNSISRSTEKIFLPPYYREFIDATDLDLYDRVLSSTGPVNGSDFAELVRIISEGLGLLQGKIERAYELQCWQVLLDGIVQLQNGTNIDFKRKAASLVDANVSLGGYWTASVDPFAQIETGAKFLRQSGKAQGAVINMIAGSSAKAALYDNAKFKETAELRRVDNLAIRMPQRESVGATTHGEFAAGDYTVRLWTYPEYYDNASGVSTPYVNPKKVILLPESVDFKLAFAAVPRLLGDGSMTSERGEYVFSDYIDPKHSTHEYDIKSAGVAIPVSVDKIWTAQVVA
jgi:hypothetical protein